MIKTSKSKVNVRYIYNRKRHVWVNMMLEEYQKATFFLSLFLYPRICLSVSFCCLLLVFSLLFVVVC